MDLIYDFLADNIKKLRNEMGISQSKLAELAGISLRGLQDIEYKKNIPRTSTLKKIAMALNIDIAELTKVPTTTPLPPAEYLELIKKNIENAILSVNDDSDSDTLKISKLEIENEALKKEIQILNAENNDMKNEISRLKDAFNIDYNDNHLIVAKKMAVLKDEEMETIIYLLNGLISGRINSQISKPKKKKMAT